MQVGRFWPTDEAVVTGEMDVTDEKIASTE